jgi:hypothetical protein
VDASNLPVGSPVRQDAGVAIVGALVLTAAYAAVTVIAKETPALYVRQPWQDDPYDVLVSLDFIALPLLVAICVLRVQLCRRYEPLPIRRLIDLLRGCRVALGLSFVTQLAEWIAVLQSRDGGRWTLLTTWQVVVLGAFTAATIVFGVLLERARRAVCGTAHATAQPDWLADAVVLGLREACRLGPLRALAQSAVGWANLNVISRVRAHPIAAAALVAAVLTVPEVVAKIVLERYPASLVVFVFVVSTASLFALLVVVGAYLRVVAPNRARPSVWPCAAVVACTAGTLAVAFRDPLLQSVGSGSAHATTVMLTELLLGAGVAAGVLSLAAQTAFRRLRRYPR